MRQSSEPCTGSAVVVPHLFPDASIMWLTIRSVQLPQTSLLVIE